MAEGWKLNEGAANYEFISEDQLWAVVMKSLSSQTVKATSYKFALLRAILENLYRTTTALELSFLQLGESFAKLYWNLVIYNNYSQGNKSRIESELLTFQAEHKIPFGLSFDSLSEFHKQSLISRIEKKVVTPYVVGALYADLEGLVYGFSKKERKISLTQVSYEYLMKYQTTIFKLVNFELAKFLQKKNLQTPKGILLEEIENITKRESLQQYQKIILNQSGNKCFYTDKPLPQKKQSIAVDHFVPWSFLHSDELWNFVLTSPSLNSGKGSKLPAERFLSKLHQRNQLFRQHGDVHVKSQMEQYDFERFAKLYRYAEVNGFEKGWHP